MLASMAAHLEAAQWLLAHGADIHAQNVAGENALSYALTFDGPEAVLLPVVKLLLAHNADVNAVGEGGFTALMRAAGKGYFSIVKLLVEHGADVNAHTPTDEEDMSQASAQEQIAQLEADADVQSVALANEIKRTGKPVKLMTVTLSETPLSLATTSEIRAYLIKHGAKEE